MSKRANVALIAYYSQHNGHGNLRLSLEQHLEFLKREVTRRDYLQNMGKGLQLGIKISMELYVCAFVFYEIAQQSDF